MHRYFADWQVMCAAVPDFVYPECAPDPHVHTAGGLHADLSSRDAALQAMWASLQEALPLPAGPYDPAAPLPPSQLSYDVAAAAARQSDFYYQVSLPHYQDETFLRAAVARCNVPTCRAVPAAAHPT